MEFFDDSWPSRTRNGDWSVVGNSTTLLERLQEYDGVIVAIGNNTVRHGKLSELLASSAPVVSLVHPAAVVSRYASIGAGSVVFAGVVVNADASVGIGAILNSGCSVDHDCRLADAIHVGPGARVAGGVSIGEDTWIGIGASIRQMVTVGAQVVVGAGAAVVNDVSDNVVVVGVPAKVVPGS
ncbi:putative acetyltransferase EpsM [compost metagenome]